MLLHHRANHADHKQYACHDLSIWNERQKSHLLSQNVFLQLEHNLPVREKNSLEQAAFWHEWKSCVAYTIKFFTRNSSEENRLQNSPYFCVFKYARAVKQRVWSEAENGESDWGETLKIGLSVLHTLYSFELLPASPSHGQFPLAKFWCKLSSCDSNEKFAMFPTVMIS